MDVHPPKNGIRRPRPSPRQGRRLGIPEVWSLFLLACHYLAFRQALRPPPSAVKGVQACFEQALRPLPSVVKGVQACRLPPKTLRSSFGQALPPLPSVAKGVQACRLPGLKCLKRCAAASSRHSGHCPLLLRAFKPAVCQASNASNAARQLRAGTQATALCC